MTTKTKNESAKDRLAAKLAKKTAQPKENVLTTETKKAKPRKERRKLTIAEIKKKAIAAAERAEKLARQVELAENPELQKLIAAVEEAEKAVAKPNRFIATLEKGIRSREDALHAARCKLAARKRERSEAASNLVKAQKALEQARAKLT